MVEGLIPGFVPVWMRMEMFCTAALTRVPQLI